MKYYIRATQTLDSGSYLLTRAGKLIPVKLHVPSTTYQSRQIYRLAPTDAQFLLDRGMIDENVAKYVLLTDFLAFLEAADVITYGLSDALTYMQYAELRFAPSIRELFTTYVPLSGNSTGLEHLKSELGNYDNQIADLYQQLSEQYVKVSRFGNTVEFRISSDDGFDWNKLIIDDVILKYENSLKNCRFNILKETDGNFRAYFENASLNDILENDNIVLSSTLYRRKIIGNRLTYEKVM